MSSGGHSERRVRPDADAADRALVATAALFDGLGVHVHLCGDVRVDAVATQTEEYALTQA